MTIQPLTTFFAGYNIGMEIRGKDRKEKIYRVSTGYNLQQNPSGDIYQMVYNYVVPSSISNPQSGWIRYLFSTAVSRWKNVLTEEEKETYRARAENMSGYNLYIREFMEENKVEFRQDSISFYVSFFSVLGEFYAIGNVLDGGGSKIQGEGDSYFSGKLGIGTTLPSTFFHNTGGMTLATRIVSANTFLGAEDYILLVDSSVSSIIITIPDSLTLVGRVFIVRDIGNNASVKNITVKRATFSSITIEFSHSYIINTNSGYVSFVAGSETAWYKVG